MKRINRLLLECVFTSKIILLLAVQQNTKLVQSSLINSSNIDFQERILNSRSIDPPIKYIWTNSDGYGRVSEGTDRAYYTFENGTTFTTSRVTGGLRKFASSNNSNANARVPINRFTGEKCNIDYDIFLHDDLNASDRNVQVINITAETASNRLPEIKTGNGVLKTNYSRGAHDICAKLLRTPTKVLCKDLKNKIQRQGIGFWLITYSFRLTITAISNL